MKKIILDEIDCNTINLSNVIEGIPIFAKRDGVFCGMVVKEEGGWILKVGGSRGATGHYSTPRKCIESCVVHNYTFFVN
ncbi:MAG: hypothetical protein KAS87_05265 [Candidatus Omnitrophica bacterium]|nr:hypothetical protein [Candidatus Omnitrophota bacterium]